MVMASRCQQSLQNLEEWVWMRGEGAPTAPPLGLPPATQEELPSPARPRGAPHSHLCLEPWAAGLLLPWGAQGLKRSFSPPQADENWGSPTRRSVPQPASHLGASALALPTPQI